MPIDNASRGDADADWAASAASKPNGASRTPAKRAAVGGRGYAEWRTFRSLT